MHFINHLFAQVRYPQELDLPRVGAFGIATGLCMLEEHIYGRAQYKGFCLG